MSHPSFNRRDSLKSIAALGMAGISPLAFAQKPLTVGVIYVGPRDDFGYNQAQAQALSTMYARHMQASEVRYRESMRAWEKENAGKPKKAPEPTPPSGVKKQ